MSETRIIALTVPRLGETMEEGAVRDWLKAVGDRFVRGDAIVEIETDKTIAEVPAMMDGRLVEIVAESGQTLDVGATLARIEVAASDAPAEADPSDGAAADAADAANTADTADTADTGHAATRQSAAPSGSDPVGDTIAGEATGSGVVGPIRATPAARRVARRADIDIRTVTGTGRRGRVESHDVREAVSRGGARIGGAASAGAASAGALGNAGSASLQRIGDIAYTIGGPTDGAPTMLLHGFAADHGAWAALTQALSRAGRRVVVPDLPGHGATTREATTVEALSVGLEDVAGLCAGSRPCHLVAHSLGAAAAVALAGRVPVASLTLIAPAGMGSHIDVEFVRGMASPGSAGELSHLLRRLSDGPSLLSATAIETLTASLSPGRLVKLAAAIVGEIGQTLDLVPAIDALAQRMPVRVIVGHRDRIIDWRDACRLSTRVAVHHFPQAGHMPHWDSPREVAELLVGNS